MGIDLQSGGRYVGHKQREAPKSKNVYLNLLVQVSFASIWAAGEVQALAGLQKSFFVAFRCSGCRPRSLTSRRGNTQPAAESASEGIGRHGVGEALRACSLLCRTAYSSWVFT
jgi:hypothetical protein